MPKKEKNAAELIQVLDCGITLADILYDLAWVRKERGRLKDKEARKRQRKKKEKVEVPEPETSGTEENQG